MGKRFAFAVLLMLPGCASYDPPVGGDHHAAKYQAALAKCHTEAEKHASQVANATPSSAVKSLFTSAKPEHDDETACMVSRGYPRL